MNKIKMMSLAGCFMLAMAATSTNVTAQQLKMPAPSPAQTLKQSFGLGDITLEYSRPAAKGRVVFGDLVPYGKIWRTGANGASKITFTEDVTFGGKSVKAGTYAIYTIPGKSSWTIMLYSDLTLGGNVANYDDNKEVARVTATPKYTENKTESFTLGIAKVLPESAILEMMWEHTRVTVKIGTEIDSKVMKNIESVMNNDTKPYFQAASYYYETNRDLDQAREWASKAAAQNPKAFWIKLLKAKIELKQGDKKSAKATANEVIDLAREAKNDDYVKMAKKLIAQAENR